jgi:hypothetical protein
MGFPLDHESLAAHRQLSKYSCIPMVVELILKQLKQIPNSSFKFQQKWKDKRDGTFGDFDGRTIKGVTFHRRFSQQRGSAFPLVDLFTRIEGELRAGRLVAISLAVPGGWHNYVAYDQATNGDFLVVTKGGPSVANVKQAITSMEGTDILVYDDFVPKASANISKRRKSKARK